MSADARDAAAEFIEAEYHVLWNGVEVDDFRTADPAPTEGPTILFMGRHEPRKGLDVLLEAMRTMPADVRLWVAGDGPDTERLRSQVAGDRRISWLGRVSDAEKARLMRGADVFCTPSLGGESFGIVLLEGMAAGTPVVASDLPGYRAVADGGRFAALFPPGDAAALTQTLSRVLADVDGGAKELVENGDQRADEYSMERLAEAYVGYYDEAVARNRLRGR